MAIQPTTLYLRDPEVASEVEYLDWELNNQDEGESTYTISVYGDNFLLDRKQATNLVNQYQDGRLALKMAYSESNEQMPLMTAIQTIGMDKLYEYNIHEFLEIPIDELNADSVAMKMSHYGASGSSSLFKLISFMDAIKSSELDHNEFKGLVPNLTSFDLLDDAAELIHNSSEKMFKYQVSTVEDDERPITPADLKKSLSHMITLARFNEVIKNNSAIPMSTLQKTYRLFQVVDLIADFALGRIIAGIQPSALSENFRGGYSARTNSFYYKDEPMTKYGIIETINNEGKKVVQIHIPERFMELHESTHAFQDKTSAATYILTNTEQEAESWTIQGIFEYFEMGAAAFDKLTKEMKRFADLKVLKIESAYRMIANNRGIDSFMKHIRPAIQGLGSRVAARKLAKAIKAGRLPSKAEIDKIMGSAVMSYQDGRLNDHLMDHAFKNRHLLDSVKKIRELNSTTPVNMPTIDSTGNIKLKGVKMKSDLERKKWFNANKTNALMALDYLDTFTIEGSDKKLAKSLDQYCQYVLLCIAVEARVSKPDEAFLSDLNEHFVTVARRRANQAAKTPIKDRGI